MTLGEAIKILERYMECDESVEPVELDKAVQLGIEALNYINICRHNPNCFQISLLPGETEE